MRKTSYIKLHVDVLSLECASTEMASSAPVSLCEIIATVPTGLEHGAADECREILGREAKIQRGRILIELLSMEELTKVSKYRFLHA